jgi:hypothetical protein
VKKEFLRFLSQNIQISIKRHYQFYEGKMIGKKTIPFSQENIDLTDALIAKHLLVGELIQIQEFIELWTEVREIHAKIIETVKPTLENLFAGLSPEARGALMSMEGTAYALYDEDVRKEAEIAAAKLKLVVEAVNDWAKEEEKEIDYRSSLEAIVKPLNVPDLGIFMMVWDIKLWGIYQISKGRIAGPASDLLESTIIRGLTDLSPIEAMSETRALFKQRIKRKISPLSRHLKLYALQRRIHLWVRNVVCGESIRQIAESMDPAVGYSSDDWVRQQIRDASRILGVKRVTGRPRKGGVIRVWKLMAK